MTRKFRVYDEMVTSQTGYLRLLDKGRHERASATHNKKPIYVKSSPTSDLFSAFSLDKTGSHKNEYLTMSTDYSAKSKTEPTYKTGRGRPIPRNQSAVYKVKPSSN
jgi:hypothetical protein